MTNYYITYNDHFGYCVVETGGKIVFAGNIEDCNKKCIELNATNNERMVNNMKHTITMKEIQNMIKNGVSTFMKKDNSPRGCKCVDASQIKIGDEFVINNYFTMVIE